MPLTPIITLKGKARQVFQQLDLIAKYHGDRTLGEIILGHSRPIETLEAVDFGKN